MTFGMEVGLGPGHIVLDRDRASSPLKRGHSPNFRPMSIVAKRMDGSRLAYYVVEKTSTRRRS